MAKAKKPASGGKPSTPESKDVSPKESGVTPKAEQTAKAAPENKPVQTKATAAKDDATASGSSKVADVNEKKDSTATTAKAESDKKTDKAASDAARVSGTPKTAARKDATAASAKSESTTSSTSTSATTSGSDGKAGKRSASTAVSPAPSVPATTPTPEKRRSVFWPLVLGGVVAGGIGFVVSEMNVLNTRVDTTKISDAVAAQGERIAALEEVEPAEPAQAEAPDLSGIEVSLASIGETVTALEERLKTLEERPAPVTQDTGALAQYAEELTELQLSVEQQKAEIDRLLENAQSIEEATAEAAQRADIQAALSKIMTALNAGSSYTDAVDALHQSGVSDVPEALSVNAAEGVPTLVNLQSEYPVVARAGLASARAAGTDDGEAGFGGFLRRQLGARSVAPREGNGPDAVLSRAGAAVRAGQIAQALTEIETLPSEAQDAMSDWIAAARSRADAEAAVQDLSQRLTAN